MKCVYTEIVTLRYGVGLPFQDDYVVRLSETNKNKTNKIKCTVTSKVVRLCLSSTRYRT